MPDPPKIERRKVFTVAHAQLNSYGDLMVTDTENNEYKIGNKRSQLHELFQTDAVVEVGYSSYKDREYIAVAHPFEGVAPTQNPTPPVEASKPKVIAPQEKGLWCKELGEMLRGKDIDTTTAHGKLLRAWYYTEMFRVLEIEFKEKGEVQ